MMFRSKIIAPALVLLGGFAVCTTTSFGKAEYTRKEKKACTFCHVDAKAKPKELTDAGRYYKDKNSLDGFKK